MSPSELDAIEACRKAWKNSPGQREYDQYLAVALPAVQTMIDEIRWLREALEAEKVVAGNVRQGLAICQEREAKLREAAEQMLAVEYVTVGGQLSPQYMAARTALRGALNRKGGS